MWFFWELIVSLRQTGTRYDGDESYIKGENLIEKWQERCYVKTSIIHQQLFTKKEKKREKNCSTYRWDV